MNPKDFNAVIDLVRESLNPQEFEEFRDELRRQLREEMGPDLEATKKGIRYSYFKLVKHVQAILSHFGEELDSASVTSAPSAPSAPPPPPAPSPSPSSSSTPIEIPPAIKAVIRPSARSSKSHRRDRTIPIMSSARDREILVDGILTCLRSTGKSALGVSFADILNYLEKVIHFPVNSAYWQHKTRDNRSRFEAAVRFQLRKLQEVKKIRKTDHFWYLA